MTGLGDISTMRSVASEAGYVVPSPGIWSTDEVMMTRPASSVAWTAGWAQTYLVSAAAPSPPAAGEGQPAGVFSCCNCWYQRSGRKLFAANQPLERRGVLKKELVPAENRGGCRRAKQE